MQRDLHVKFYKIARLLGKLFFAMETKPICTGFKYSLNTMNLAPISFM